MHARTHCACARTHARTHAHTHTCDEKFPKAMTSKPSLTPQEYLQQVVVCRLMAKHIHALENALPFGFSYIQWLDGAPFTSVNARMNKPCSTRVSILCWTTLLCQKTSAPPPPAPTLPKNTEARHLSSFQEDSWVWLSQTSTTFI